MKNSLGNENTHFSVYDKENSALRSKQKQSLDEDIIPASESEPEEPEEKPQKKRKAPPANAFGFIDSSQEESEEESGPLLEFERPDSKEYSCPYQFEKSSLQKETVKKISCMKRELNKTRSTTKNELTQFLQAFDQS